VEGVRTRFVGGGGLWLERGRRRDLWWVSVSAGSEGVTIEETCLLNPTSRRMSNEDSMVVTSEVLREEEIWVVTISHIGVQDGV